MPSLPFHSYSIATASSGRLINVCAEAAPSEAAESGKAPLILTRTPGIDPYFAPPAGAGRGLHAMKGQLFHVCGDKLYRNFSRTPVGTIVGTERQYMANNGTQLAIIGETAGYVYSGGGLARISDGDFVAGPSIYLDGYLLSVHPETGQFASSDLFDFENFDGLDFATAESDPDDLITIAGDHKQAVLIGVDTCEIWANNPQGSGFPWELIGSSGVIQIGGTGPRAVINQDQTVFWLANDRTLRALRDGTPARVSQHGAERKWQNYSRVDDCEFSKYTINGHVCVVMRFPTANATWLYDCTTKEMSELEGRRYQMWDVSDIAVLRGVTYVQRASTGEIGILDPRCYRQWGETLRAEWTYQNIYQQGDPITLGQLELGIQTGVGNEDEPDPHLTLEMSYDGGENFDHTMATRPIGRQGKTREKVRWGPCGYGTDLVPRISLAEAVPLTLWDTQYSVD